MTAFTISPGPVYTKLQWLFKRCAWCWLDKALGITDLSERGKVVGQSLELDGKVLFDWAGTPVIKQKWDRIAIELETAQSGSE